MRPAENGGSIVSCGEGLGAENHPLIHPFRVLRGEASTSRMKTDPERTGMQSKKPIATRSLRKRLWTIIVVAVVYLLFVSMADFIPGYWEKTGFQAPTRSILTLGMVLILLVSLSGLAASEKMGSLIIREGLTGLFSQNYILQRLEEEFYRAQRYNHPLSLLLIDLDNFKAMNERYGRAAGDHLLKYFGRLIQETIRPSDVPARYGGEEFLILLPETDRYDAETVAERLRRKIASSPFRIDARRGDIQFTVSVGVCTYPDAGQSAKELVTLADLALYEAKKNGKNKVAVYTQH